MFKKIMDRLYRVFLGEKLFDLGVIMRDQRGRNAFTEVSMSINRSGDDRYVNCKIRQKTGSSTKVNFIRLNDASSLRALREGCDKLDILLSSDLSDEELKALENQFPEQS